MDARWVALGMFGLVFYQAGADPARTQEGVASFFTSANGVVRQVPVLFDSDGSGAGATSPGTPDPGMQTINLPDGAPGERPRRLSRRAYG